MLPNATIKAKNAPTPAAASSPIHKLSVFSPTTKPVIADINIDPSSDKFTTPTRSVIVSPQTAMINGVACKTIEARISTSSLSFIGFLLAAKAEFIYFAEEQDKQHHHTGKDASQGLM